MTFEEHLKRYPNLEFGKTYVINGKSITLNEYWFTIGTKSVPGVQVYLSSENTDELRSEGFWKEISLGELSKLVERSPHGIKFEEKFAEDCFSGDLPYLFEDCCNIKEYGYVFVYIGIGASGKKYYWYLKNKVDRDFWMNGEVPSPNRMEK